MSKSNIAEALLKQLKNPFDPKFVKWRVGATNGDKSKGIALAYIDSREVMKRLDAVCGAENWRDRMIPMDGGFICEIDIKIEGEWVTRSNAAGFTNIDPIKGGASDAFKRAASAWGIGRYLYYLPNIWVAVVPAGKSYSLGELPELPEWALPGKVEDWETVAEFEADLSASADSDLVDMIVSNVDQLREIKTTAELEVFIDGLDPETHQGLKGQIDAKTKELINADK